MFLEYVFRVFVSFVVYLYVSGRGSITSVGEGRAIIICLLLFTCNYVVSVIFLWVFWMGYVILLWHSLSLPYNYFTNSQNMVNRTVSKRLSTQQPKPN